MTIEPQMPLEAMQKKLKKLINTEHLLPGEEINDECVRQVAYLLCSHGFANTKFADVPDETLEALTMRALQITANGLRALARRPTPTGSEEKE